MQTQIKLGQVSYMKFSLAFVICTKLVSNYIKQAR